MDLFKLVAKLGMDSSEYERGISKARGSFSELGNQISAKAVAMGNMIAHAMEKAVNVAVNLGKSAVQNAADVTAEKAQFKVTFGTMQGEAEKAFAAIEKETGIFGTRLQKVGTKAFSQFAGAGIKGADGLEAMEEYTKLAADAAAYYDISLEDADARLRSFLRGNTEAGDAIGLFTSESQRNSAAMEKYGQKWQNLTEAQKQMLMLDISKDIYKQSGAIGQAARESDAWTNVIGNLKEAWRQASAKLGEPIMAVLTPVLKDASEWLNDPDTQTKITRFGLTVANAIKWVLNPTFPTWEEVKAGGQATLDKINEGLATAVNWTLGKLGLPDAETVKTDVKNWWTGQGDNAYERIKSVLTWSFGNWGAPAASEYTDDVQNWWNNTFKPSLTAITQWTFGELIVPSWADLMMTIYRWWTNTIQPKIKNLAKWDLGEVQFPSLGEMVSRATAWWNSVKGTISSIFKVTISPEYKKTYSQSEIDSAMDQHSDVVDSITGASTPGRHAGGLYYARNNYIAQLDEGEAVLTQREATEWRAGRSSGNADVVAAIRELMQFLTTRREVMTPDGRVIGEISYETVSQRIAQDARGRRYVYG